MKKSGNKKRDHKAAVYADKSFQLKMAIEDLYGDFYPVRINISETPTKPAQDGKI